MASAKQIAWRKKFAKLYGKKKTGSKSTKTKSSSKSWASRMKEEVDERRADLELGTIYPPNFKSIGKRDNFAWVEKSGKKYQVITFRKHSSPQEFAHKNMSKKEAINYAKSFNFLNK